MWLKNHNAETLDKLMDGFECCVKGDKIIGVQTDNLFDVSAWMDDKIIEMKGHSKPHHFRFFK